MEPDDDSQSDRTSKPHEKSQKRPRKSVRSQTNRGGHDQAQRQSQQRQIEGGVAADPISSHDPNNDRSIASQDEFVPDVFDTAVKLLITEHNHIFENRIRDILAEAKVSKDVCASVINKHREKESLKQQMRETGDAESTITLEKDSPDEIKEILPPIAAVPWKTYTDARSVRAPSVDRPRDPDRIPRGRPTTRATKDSKPTAYGNIYDRWQQELENEERKKETRALQPVRFQTPRREFLASSRSDPRLNDREQSQWHGYENREIYDPIDPVDALDGTGDLRVKTPPMQRAPDPPPEISHEGPFHADDFILDVDEEPARNWAQETNAAPSAPVFDNVFDSTRMQDQVRYFEPEPRRPTVHPVDIRRNKEPVYERKQGNQSIRVDNQDRFSERMASTIDDYDLWKLKWLESEMRDLKKKAFRNNGGRGIPVGTHEISAHYNGLTSVPSPPPTGVGPRRFSQPLRRYFPDEIDNGTMRTRLYVDVPEERKRPFRDDSRAKWGTQAEEMENVRRVPQSKRTIERDYYSSLKGER